MIVEAEDIELMDAMALAVVSHGRNDRPIDSVLHSLAN